MLRAAGLMAVLAGAYHAQTAPPRFEVASIRASDPDDPAAPSGILTSPGLLRATNVTLKRCIVGAYVVGADRVLGGPDWADAATSYNNAHSRLDAKALTMDQFAEILTRNLGLPVVNRTGLKGAFNLTLRWNPDSPGISEPEDAAAALRLEMSRAILQQLGLSLKSQRMAVDVLVIDGAQKPTDN